MPARAAHPANGDHPPTTTPAPKQQESAVVVDLAARRRAAGKHTPQPQPAGPDMDGLAADQRAAVHWAGALEREGLDLADETVARTVQAVGSYLETLSRAFLIVREGGGPRSVDPNPYRGLDRAGAEEMCALAQEMRRVVDVVRDAQRRVPQQGGGC